MGFAENLRQQRKAAGLTQAQLSHELGVTQQAVGNWEKGKSMPESATLSRLAAFLGVSLDLLMGSEGPQQAPARAPRVLGGYAMAPIPVIGTVRAGYGALAYEEDYGSELASVKDPENYFYLVVKGDSMQPRIREGDLALVHRQPTLDSGDLGVFVYGEGEGTLKRYCVRGSSVVLQPFNPAYKELVISGEALDQLHVVGKVTRTVSQW